MQVTREGHWKFGTAMLKSNGKVSRARFGHVQGRQLLPCVHRCGFVSGRRRGGSTSWTQDKTQGRLMVGDPIGVQGASPVHVWFQEV